MISNVFKKLERSQDTTAVLIAGPTASGKSALALEIASRFGGIILNADALQCFDGWSVVTARPGPADLKAAPHALYGHVPFEQTYSTGAWLRDLRPYLNAKRRPIIVGGTGLNFAALTQGLAEIPLTPPAIRARADQMSLEDMISGLDAQTCARIDLRNRARVQRAWEVQTHTGRGMAKWQDDTPPPDLPLDATVPVVLEADKAWLEARIIRRFDVMLEHGALAEARALLSSWDPALPAAKAIGGPELIAHLRGEISLAEAREAAIIASRQYAKRQRTWFRKRMADWIHVDAETMTL